MTVGPLRPPNGTGYVEHLRREMAAMGADRVLAIWQRPIHGSYLGPDIPWVYFLAPERLLPGGLTLELSVIAVYSLRCAGRQH